MVLIKIIVVIRLMGTQIAQTAIISIVIIIIVIHQYLFL